MRDPDKVQEYEAAQQRLVESIISSLHEATREDQNYRDTFGQLSRLMVDRLTGREGRSMHAGRIKELYSKKIWLPIITFVQKRRMLTEAAQIEQKYLTLKVFEKVFDSVSSGIIGEYNRHEMKLEPA